MNRHSLHYIDLHPEHVNTAEPSPLAIWAGAALAMFVFWANIAFLFSL
jgi:hypothetical protein